MNNFVLKISFTVNLLQLYLKEDQLYCESFTTLSTSIFITIGMINQKFLGLYRCVLIAYISGWRKFQIQF